MSTDSAHPLRDAATDDAEALTTLLLDFSALDGSWLTQLYVDPDHHGRRVGRTLLDDSKRRRPQGPRLHVFTRNTRAETDTLTSPPPAAGSPGDHARQQQGASLHDRLLARFADRSVAGGPCRRFERLAQAHGHAPCGAAVDGLHRRRPGGVEDDGCTARAVDRSCP